MKKVFALALTFVALAGIVQISTPPAHAIHCEECCEELYEECLITVGQPQMCNTLRNACLADC